ncbi:hypothetical protein PR048_009729, partial [Dryococelus australis]
MGKYMRAFKDAAIFNPFKELCNLAIAVLSIPHSNGEVERVFSAMNIVKPKLRNRLGKKNIECNFT